MARSRSNPLPRGITVRARRSGPDVYQVNFTDQTGKLRQELAGGRLEDAKRLLVQRRREVKEGRYVPGGAPSAAMTIETLGAQWIAERRAQGMRSWKDAERHVRLHIVPGIGRKRVGELRPREVAAWVQSMKDAGKLSAKSINNVHGTLHAILEVARFRELVVGNPASLPRGMLPRPSKKKQPRFERDEIALLLGDERIAEHRRVFYAMQALGGLRLGEASGRRWGDLSFDGPLLAERAPGLLHALRVATQYEDKPLKTAKDEDVRERLVPVHPVLADILDRWLSGGFELQFGRAPRPDDWLIPDPRTGKPRTQNQARRALARDCELVGIEARGTHSFRRAFISLARSGGAPKDLLEVITHNARGAIIDVYTTFEWPSLCGAVRCLRFALGDDTGEAPDCDPNDPQVTTDASVPTGERPRPGIRGTFGPVLDSEPKEARSDAEIDGGGGSRTPSEPVDLADSSALSTPEHPGDVPRFTGRSRSIPERLTRVKKRALWRAEGLLREAGHLEEADALAEILAEILGVER